MGSHYWKYLKEENIFFICPRKIRAEKGAVRRFSSCQTLLVGFLFFSSLPNSNLYIHIVKHAWLQMYYNAGKISLGTLSLNIVVSWDIFWFWTSSHWTHPCMHEYMHMEFLPLFSFYPDQQHQRAWPDFWVRITESPIQNTRQRKTLKAKIKGNSTNSGFPFYGKKNPLLTKYIE